MGIKTSAVAAIAAANGLPPPSATVITLNNAVLEAGAYNRVLHSGDASMTLLLPPAPTDGMLAGVVFVGFTSANSAMLYDGNGKDIVTNGGVVEIGETSVADPVVFRFDEDQDLWTVSVGAVRVPK